MLSSEISAVPEILRHTSVKRLEMLSNMLDSAKGSWFHRGPGRGREG
jgi:hypothetical protein